MNANKKNTTAIQKDIFRSNINILSENYDIGQLIHQEQINSGDVNDSYIIDMLRNGKNNRYLMRRYNKRTPEEKIRFEHTLHHELQIRNFKFSPQLISTKSGKTYQGISRQQNNRAHEYYVAVFSFLPGKDKYSWDSPLCSHGELINAAKVLSLYHNTIFSWKGIRCWKEQCNLDTIRLMATKWDGFARQATKFPFDVYFLKRFGYLLNMLRRNIPSQKMYAKMPRLAVHGDFHPGNLKFHEEKVTGVFDFDWAKIDARCFDVGLAIIYFCSSWGNINDGTIHLGRVKNFLGAYQEDAKMNKTIGPLNKLELDYLPHMIHMGNLIVVDWIISDYFRTSQYHQHYLKYLRHNLSLNRWLEKNWKELVSCIQRHRT